MVLNQMEVHGTPRERPRARRPRSVHRPRLAVLPPIDVGRGRRVLVVDDEPTLRRSIAGYLRDSGYTVDEAANGGEALDRMRAATPDVVLLDLLMPVMGGRAFMAACRQEVRFAAVPVVLLSASQDVALAAEELQPRVSLAKPVDLDVLLAVVDRVSQT